MTLFARFVSWVFHPLFMPMYTIMLASIVDPRLLSIPRDLRLMFFVFLASVTVALPGLTVLYFKFTGQISSLSMPERKERILPFFITLLFYGICYYRIMHLPLDSAVLCMLLGAMLALALCILITLSWKISAHMIGIGGFLGALLALTLTHNLWGMKVILCAIVLIAGLVGTARLLLGAHKQGEVYAGFLVGLCCVFSVVALNKPFLF